jgi:hypothetical protein
MMASLSARRRSTLALSVGPEILTWQRSTELILPSALMALLMNMKGLVIISPPFVLRALARVRQRGAK